MTHPEPADDLDPREAWALLRRETGRVRSSLDTRARVQLVVWAVAWLVGFGVMWLDVRDQRPYAGPGGASQILFGVLIVAALAVSLVLVARATRGIGGPADRQGRTAGIVWAGGFAGLFALVGAAARQGAPPEAMAVLIGCGSVLVTGLGYLCLALMLDDPVLRGLGAWLVVLAAWAGWLGPVGLVGVAAIAGGAGFAVAAVLSGRRRRPAADR